MAEADCEDLKYRAEFERQQFQVYETRRLAEETQANAVMASAVAVSAFLFNDYARKHHPGTWLAVLFIVALVALAVTFVFALNARIVSWESRRVMQPRLRRRRHKHAAKPVPAKRVARTLTAVRCSDGDPCELRRPVQVHWRARRA